MRLPEALFPVANRTMALLLCSPLHGLASGSIMLLRFSGRRTGKRRATPVRYLRDGPGRVVCLTSRGTAWWHNFRDAPADVELRLAGRSVAATAQAVVEDDARTEAVLRRMLAAFPSDAPYHGIAVKRGASPSAEQIRAAVATDVLVVFELAG